MIGSILNTAGDFLGNFGNSLGSGFGSNWAKSMGNNLNNLGEGWASMWNWGGSAIPTVNTAPSMTSLGLSPYSGIDQIGYNAMAPDIAKSISGSSSGGIFGNMLNPSTMFGNYGLAPTVIGGLSALGSYSNDRRTNELIEEQMKLADRRYREQLEHEKQVLAGNIADRYLRRGGPDRIGNPYGASVEEALSRYGLEEYA